MDALEKLDCGVTIDAILASELGLDGSVDLEIFVSGDNTSLLHQKHTLPKTTSPLRAAAALTYSGSRRLQ